MIYAVDEGACMVVWTNQWWLPIYRSVMCIIQEARVPDSLWHTGLDIRLILSFLAEVFLIERKLKVVGIHADAHADVKTVWSAGFRLGARDVL
jgi:hypothetical protein